MAHFPNDSNLARDSITILTNTVALDMEYQQMLTNANIVNTIHIALQNNPDDMILKEEASKALKIFTDKDDLVKCLQQMNTNVSQTQQNMRHSFFCVHVCEYVCVFVC